MNAKIFPLQHVADERGQLSIIEEGLHCPFDVKRVFWIFDVPQGRHRGAHAHRVCHEFIVAIEGSFDVTLLMVVNIARYTLTVLPKDCTFHQVRGPLNLILRQAASAWYWQVWRTTKANIFAKLKIYGIQSTRRRQVFFSNNDKVS